MNKHRTLQRPERRADPQTTLLTTGRPCGKLIKSATLAPPTQASLREDDKPKLCAYAVQAGALFLVRISAGGIGLALFLY